MKAPHSELGKWDWYVAHSQGSVKGISNHQAFPHPAASSSLRKSSAAAVERLSPRPPQCCFGERREVTIKSTETKAVICYHFQMLLDLPSVWQCGFLSNTSLFKDNLLCLNRKYFVSSGRKSYVRFTQSCIFQHVARTINMGLLIWVVIGAELEF